MTVISVHQHIEHHVHMWVGQQVSVGHAQVSVTEMPGDQEVLLTGQENHGQLSDHIANVGSAQSWVEGLQRHPTYGVNVCKRKRTISPD